MVVPDKADWARKGEIFQSFESTFRAETFGEVVIDRI